MEAKDKYKDIIQLPRPVSRRHCPMSDHDRAAQFAPFAALTGFDGCIREAGRETEGAVCLTEGRMEELNAALCRLLEIIHSRPRVTLTHFSPDKRKAGGAYRTTVGNLKKIDPLEGILVLTDGQVIPISSVTGIEF